jgi:hypothetical protein
MRQILACITYAAVAYAAPYAAPNNELADVTRNDASSTQWEWANCEVGKTYCVTEITDLGTISVPLSLCSPLLSAFLFI